MLYPNLWDFKSRVYSHFYPIYHFYILLFHRIISPFGVTKSPGRRAERAFAELLPQAVLGAPSTPLPGWARNDRAGGGSRKIREKTWGFSWLRGFSFFSDKDYGYEDWSHTEKIVFSQRFFWLRAPSWFWQTELYIMGISAATTLGIRPMGIEGAWHLDHNSSTTFGSFLTKPLAYLSFADFTFFFCLSQHFCCFPPFFLNEHVQTMFHPS